MPVPYALVIVNPAAGCGSTAKEWPRIHRQLTAAGLSFDFEFTLSKGQAIEIARRAAEAGYACLVAVGGDGTVNEVANGILCSTRPAGTLLGQISCGSTCSFGRSVGIPRDYAGACSLLTGNGRTTIDVGVAGYRCRGQTMRRYFVNAADAGLASVIADSWKYLPGGSGRRINHLLRTLTGLRCLGSQRNTVFKLRFGDESKSESMLGCNITVANGQYLGDGMRMAPHARLDDGLLDIVTAGNLTRFELLKSWPRLYRGTHLGHSQIQERKAASLAIESDEPILIEADGEILGESPASFAVIPAALSIVV
jgi:diacylglycerol kinase (ATP)